MTSKKIKGYKTVDIDMCSWYDPEYKYEVGKTFTIKDPALTGAACGRGLHFCRNRDYVWDFTSNDQYILLEVEANIKDVLGEDSRKTRVSKLKIVKVLEEKTPYSQAFKKAAKEVEAMKLGKSYMKPVNVNNKKKINPLANSLLKYFNCSKVRITDNIFEMGYFFQRNDALFHYSTERLDIYDVLEGINSRMNFPKFRDLKENKLSLYTQNLAESIVCGYLTEVASNNSSESEIQRLKTLVKILSLGALPIGPCGNKTFVVFAPSKETFEQMKVME